MRNIDWQRVQQLFEAALELDQSEREAFVRRECGDDSKVCSEVLGLLDSDESGNSLFETSAMTGLGISDDSHRIGTIIGSYRLTRQIGVGGMGVVFLAERADQQFQQQVAIKLIKTGMDSGRILRRFTSERQILARLDHPNIARLLGGGVSDDGLPYFTMEYVDGIPVDHYCNTKNSSVADRLRIFTTVCRAVQYAQQNLVIHRDLKPSNILVKSDGTVKLLDFGIAKVLNPGDRPDFGSDRTLTEIRAMTPLYASPEQILGRPSTLASDVYSLGVILYRLLTGLHPYEVSDLSPREIERIICEIDPNRPSSAFARTAEHATEAQSRKSDREELSSRRSSTPAKLEKILAGDLDAICMKALRKEPDHRYPTAQQLADDIQRCLDNRPVEARVGSARYRAKRFLKRNRVAISTATSVIVLIVALIAFYTVKLSRERDLAKLEAAKSAQISDFLIHLFEVSDPNTSKGEDLTAREILDRGANRIATELADQPETQGMLMGVIGGVYYQMGQLETADDYWTAALELKQKTLGKDHVEVADGLHDLAVVRHDKGDYEDAVKLYREALRIHVKALGRKSGAAAADMNDLAASLRRMGNLDEAEKLYREALDIRRSLFGEMDADVAHSMNHLGRLLHTEGELDKAEPLLRQALAIRRKLYDNEHVEVVASLGSLAQLVRDKGDLDEAEQLLREALSIIHTLMGEDHHYVGGISNVLADVLFREEKLDSAEFYYRYSQKIRDRTLPVDHLGRTSSMVGLANLLIEKGELEEADSLLQVALDIRGQALPPDDWRVAQVKSVWGRARLAMGDTTIALGLLKESYAILMEKRGADDPETERCARALREIEGSRERTSR